MRVAPPQDGSSWRILCRIPGRRKKMVKRMSFVAGDEEEEETRMLSRATCIPVSPSSKTHFIQTESSHSQQTICNLHFESSSTSALRMKDSSFKIRLSFLFGFFCPTFLLKFDAYNNPWEPQTLCHW